MLIKSAPERQRVLLFGPFRLNVAERRLFAVPVSHDPRFESVRECLRSHVGRP